MSNEREKWFFDRVGKVIYRNKTNCKCGVCENVYQNGLLLSDKNHASYVCSCESEITFEGGNLRYFDTKEERDDFEDLLKTITNQKKYE